MTTEAITPLRQRMIEDMNARKLGKDTQRGHVYSCKRFAAFLNRSPETATAEDIRGFQLHLSETGASICNRNRIMTGLRFLFRVTLRRLDLAAEIYHLREPQKIPQVISRDEARRLLAVADSPADAPFAQPCLRLRITCRRSGPARRESFASSKARAARIAMSCSHPSCSMCCGNGGGSGHRVTMRQRPLRNVGCFPVNGQASR